MSPSCEAVETMTYLYLNEKLLKTLKDKLELEAGAVTWWQAAHFVAFKYEVMKTYLFVIRLCSAEIRNQSVGQDSNLNVKPHLPLCTDPKPVF